MNEKDWKKDGLNPVFPLAGLMLLIRFHPVRPTERPPGAPAMCTPRGCVGAPVRVRAPVRVSVRVSVRVVVWCAPECTRGVPEGRLSVIV